MFKYLKPADRPIFNGLESEEVVYAKDQPEYIPLRTLVSESAERRVISRWTFTDEQRKAIAEGADIFLELLTFEHPLQPIRMAVSDGDVDPDWVRVCLLDKEAKNLEESA